MKATLLWIQRIKITELSIDFADPNRGHHTLCDALNTLTIIIIIKAPDIVFSGAKKCYVKPLACFFQSVSFYNRTSHRKGDFYE